MTSRRIDGERHIAFNHQRIPVFVKMTFFIINDVGLAGFINMPAHEVVNIVNRSISHVDRIGTLRFPTGNFHGLRSLGNAVFINIIHLELFEDGRIIRDRRVCS